MENFKKFAQTPDPRERLDTPSPHLDTVAPAAGILDLRQSLEIALRREEEAWQELALLGEVLNQLPVGVIVQAEDGTPIFVNSAATEFGEAPSHKLIDPAAGASFAAPVSRRDGRMASIDPDSTISTETTYADEFGKHTLLTMRKSVVIQNELLRLSTSIDITDRKQAEEELARRAHYDELTGLPNRFLFQKRVETLIAKADEHFAIAFIDIDNFKQINDYHGHAVGDALLIKAGARIQRNIRDRDVLARISGDEFLVLLNPLEYGDELDRIIGNLTIALKEPFIVDGLEIFSSASIGVSSYPEHGLDYETLRRNADRAMYHVKRDTKGAAALFHPGLQASDTARVLAEQRLRQAIQDRRFRCAFQPKVEINTEEVIGVEALARLLDEDGELHDTGSFVHLATELGLIDDLTHLVVCQIGNSIDLINETFGPRTTISVNISAKQASDVDFMHSIAESLKETNCSDRFIVEVTEDAFVAKNRFQTQVLPMLREIGVRVSIDDFGTGYSSLSALADITADEIKVDRSFITNIHERPRSQIVLRAIESLGGALGMTVIAEGVESFEELLYLKSATRIRYVQGYYFARPLLLEDISLRKRPAGETRTAAGGRETQNRRITNRRFR